ncbi:MAG: hypothetical protein LBE44_10325, partial [Microbacterium hominis]|nr:hypothetical protein [Microbacterium hominis]
GYASVGWSSAGVGRSVGSMGGVVDMAISRLSGASIVPRRRPQRMHGRYIETTEDAGTKV